MNKHYIHHIPGRVRVWIPALKPNAKAARELQLTMQELPGVASVEVNLLTGSLLVHYDGGSATAKLVFGLLQRRGLWPGSNAIANLPLNAPSRSALRLQPASKIVTEQIGEKVVEVVARYLLDVTIERLVTATLIGLL